MTPVSSQARTSHIGEPTLRAMPAETMKIPDPIIDPATSMVASVKVIALTNSGWGSVVVGLCWRAATLVIPLLRRLGPGPAHSSPGRRYSRAKIQRRDVAWLDRKEHTSELQSRQYLVCRLLLEKKKNLNCFRRNT